jgi:hypothetical protein
MSSKPSFRAFRTNAEENHREKNFEPMFSPSGAVDYQTDVKKRNPLGITSQTHQRMLIGYITVSS